MDALPPQSLEAELSVLGSILLKADCLDTVRAIIEPQHFYLDLHGHVYETALTLQRLEEPIDAVSVSTHFPKAKYRVSQHDLEQLLMKAMDTVPHAAHAAYYAGVVKSKWQLREIIATATEAIAAAYGAEELAVPSDIIAESETALRRILEDGKPRKASDLSSILMETLKSFEVGTDPGLVTGFHELDKISGGLRPGTLIIIAARPGCGKTAFVGKLLASMCKRELPGCLYSLEQTQEEIAERLLAGAAGVNSRHIRSREVDEDERFKVVSAAGELANLPCWIEDATNWSVADIAANARQKRRKNRLAFIAVDYLQIIKPADRKVSREQQVSQIAVDLKNLSKQIECPVIALAQINREIEKRPDKRPRAADLRESGGIEQAADQIWLLDRPYTYDQSKNPDDAELIIDKNRGGPKGIVKLKWDGETTTFRNLPHNEYMSQFTETFDDGF